MFCGIFRMEAKELGNILGSLPENCPVFHSDLRFRPFLSQMTVMDSECILGLPMRILPLLRLVTVATVFWPVP